jgi:hypothetical protein
MWRVGMSMSELRRLVKQYTDGEISYSEFRREFVTGFLAVRSTDADVQNAVAHIESLCADVAEKAITSEAELREQLKAALPNRFDNGNQNPVQILEVPNRGNSYISSGSTSIGMNTNTPSFA